MKRTLATLLSSLFVVLIATTALARTVPATSARISDTSEDPACWDWYAVDQSSTALARVCAGTAYVDLALPLDTFGTKTVTVYAKHSASTQQVACNTYVVKKNGAYIPGTVVHLTTISANYQSLVLPTTTSIDPDGLLWVRCSFSQGSAWLGVSYAP